MVEDLFTQALGLSAPWKVIEVKLDQKAQRIDFHVAAHTTTFDCPACGRSGAKRHDGEERQWQHLHFFQYAAFVHAEALRVACSHCGEVSALPVPWARPGSHFTLLFEAFALSLAPVMAVNQAAALLQVNATRLWRVIEHHVARARAQEDFVGVSRIGVDETACNRGQLHYRAA